MTLKTKRERYIFKCFQVSKRKEQKKIDATTQNLRESSYLSTEDHVHRATGALSSENL